MQRVRARATKRLWGYRSLQGACLGIVPSFFDLEKPRLEALLTSELGWPAYRATQLWDGFYSQGVTNLAAVRGLSNAQRGQLAPLLRFNLATIDHEVVSSDGTIKFLVKFPASPGRAESSVEVVFIPDGDRGTLCVSSQAGCSLSCKFCHTGTQKLQRNLSAGEIVGQYLVAQRRLLQLRALSDTSPSPVSLARPAPGSVTQLQSEAPLPQQLLVNRIVFMGQGEPGYNPRGVLTALRILSHGHAAPAVESTGLSAARPSAPNSAFLAPHRMTVSTAGVAPFIARLGREPVPVRLAISLHAPSDALRRSIMPINDTYPIAAVMRACAEYVSCRIASLDGRVASPEGAPLSLSEMTRWFERRGDRHNGSRRVRISFEYVLLRGVNDSVQHARELASMLLAHLPAPAIHVNLLTFNAWPGAPYQRTPLAQAEDFSRALSSAGLVATLRKSRGSDVLGACGQLKSSLEAKTTAGWHERRPKC